MRRTRTPPADLRPSWRDPNLPCIRAYRFGDGTTKTEVDPSYEQRYREMLMQTSAQPEYKNDPTYHMDKRKPNVR